MVLSDEKQGSKKIADFSGSDQRWMVAVRMVSEGVDIPRLAVGVYATTTSTPLFFAQAVGRFVRARGRGETASIFLPSVPSLLTYAAELEVARDHVLGRRDHRRGRHLRRGERPARPGPGRRGGLLRAAEPAVRGARLRRPTSTGCSSTAPSSATRARCTSAPRRRWTSSASPGCSSPTRCASSWPSARATAARSSRPGPTRTCPSSTTHEQLAVLRRELNGLVAAWHHRTGQAHGVTHAALRKECGGPAAAVASAEMLRKRIDRRARVGRAPDAPSGPWSHPVRAPARPRGDRRDGGRTRTRGPHARASRSRGGPSRPTGPPGRRRSSRPTRPSR